MELPLLSWVSLVDGDWLSVLVLWQAAPTDLSICFFPWSESWFNPLSQILKPLLTFSSVRTKRGYLKNWMCSRNVHLVITVLIEKIVWKSKTQSYRKKRSCASNSCLALFFFFKLKGYSWGAMYCPKCQSPLCGCIHFIIMPISTNPQTHFNKSSSSWINPWLFLLIHYSWLSWHLLNSW